MAALEGSQKTITTTLNYNETTGSQVDLPNSEPGTSQVIYTVASGDLPTISSAPFSVGYYPAIYVGGRNYSGGAVTVNYRVLLNGASQTTGNISVPTATSYWTLNAGHFGTVPIVEGDVLEVRLWASAATSVYWDYKCLVVLPTLLFPERRRRLMLDFSQTQGTVTLPIGGSQSSAYISYSYPGTEASQNLNCNLMNNIMTYVVDNARGAYKEGHHVTQVSSITLHATVRPFYKPTNFPAVLSYRVGPDL